MHSSCMFVNAVSEVDFLFWYYLIPIISYSSYALRLQHLMNFTITCSLNDSELHCKVDDGFAPVLPHHTTCQVRDKRPSKCEESQTHTHSLQPRLL